MMNKTEMMFLLDQSGSMYGFESNTIGVSRSYRASQYDHTADEYIPKGLSQRMYQLQDGTLVQRDWYSSFLLYCYDQQTGAINKERCGNSFSHYYDMELDMIERIVKTKTRILNSGIRV